MNKLIVLSFAACTATPAESPNLRSTELLAHADAATLCTGELHLPTRGDLQEILGNCNGAGDRVACAPCVRGENCTLRYGDDAVVSEGRVWSSTPCDGGYFVGDFATGWITCAATEALPLCVR